MGTVNFVEYGVVGDSTWNLFALQNSMVLPLGGWMYYSPIIDLGEVTKGLYLTAIWDSMAIVDEDTTFQVFSQTSPDGIAWETYPYTVSSVEARFIRLKVVAGAEYTLGDAFLLSLQQGYYIGEIISNVSSNLNGDVIWQ